MTSLGLHLRKMGHSNINQDIVPNQHPFGANYNCALLSGRAQWVSHSSLRHSRAELTRRDYRVLVT